MLGPHFRRWRESQVGKTLRWIVFGGLALLGVTALILIAGRLAAKRGQEPAVGPHYSAPLHVEGPRC